MWANPGHFIPNFHDYGHHDRVLYSVCGDDQFLNDEQPNNMRICTQAQWLAMPCGQPEYGE